MESEKIDSLENYLTVLDKIKLRDVVLFRGQREDKPLLPKIARPDPSRDTASLERQMLAEFRRRAPLLLPNSNQLSDWDLLVHAQHFGMCTRLLDWTQNPLIGLWFACCNEAISHSSFVYIFSPPDGLFITNQGLEKGPYAQGSTRVLKPTLNNARIIAQEGWFTVHRFSQKVNRFVPLEKNPNISPHVIKVEIPGSLKKEILRKLSVMGVNNQTIFSDLYGLCLHVSWIHGFRLP